MKLRCKCTHYFEKKNFLKYFLKLTNNWACKAIKIFRSTCQTGKIIKKLQILRSEVVKFHQKQIYLAWNLNFCVPTEASAITPPIALVKIETPS